MKTWRRVSFTFQLLNTAFTTSPIFVHLEFSKPFFMEIDVSDFALRAILSQLGDREKLYLVAFHSRKFYKCSLSVLQARYDLPTVEHFGFKKTLELVSRDFWWPQMWKTIKEYVLSCDILFAF